MELFWTKHAAERQQQWEQRKGITRGEVEVVAKSPEQIVPDDPPVEIAQSRYKEGLLRVPFVDDIDQRRLITIYWTSQVKRYWRGDNHADSL
ncbi:MAG: DUF4258 domain-containing protein [Cyanobacteria bacterium]|nr:DUF4258 domain-containing protein [Cyanobacteriota bacterium]